MTLEQAINHLEEELKNKQDWSCVACKEDHEQLLSWLKELQAIKNANPSEALEDLKELHKLAYDIDVWKIEDIVQSLHIKQALQKAQEQEKILNIIKEKNVDMYMLNDLGTFEEYNEWVLKKYGTYYQLTQEEFDTLKRWLR